MGAWPEINGRSVRIGVFRDRELMLHVGADLKDIEALGWEIARSLVIVIPVVLLFIAGGSWWLGSIALTLQQTRRLSSVAENLLLLSRADTGRLNLRQSHFDLRNLLEASLEDARILGLERGLQVTANLPETLPMSGDRHMISMAVQSLVENAVKYNRPHGKVLVSAEKIERGVSICIGNTGEKIPAERAPHIFERFYRVRGNEQTPGHGLGLSIARELARAHGGDLTLVESREDWTEFCLRFASELPTSPDSRVTERPPPSADGETEAA
jgi:signal transduction histidine kinase